MVFEFHAANSPRLPGSPSNSFKIIGSHGVTFSPTVRLHKSFSCNTYKKQGEGVRSRFGPLSVLSLPLYFHTCLLHLFSSPGVTPHDPATHIQPPAHAQSLDRQRTNRKDPRPPRQKLYRHHGAG